MLNLDSVLNHVILRNKELGIAFVMAGALAGMGLLIFCHALLFAFSEETFTIPVFLELHQQFAVMYAIDALPLLFVLGAWLLARLFMSKERIRQDELMHFEETRETIKEAIQELTEGKGFSKLIQAEMDPEVRQRLIHLQERLKENRKKELDRRREEDQRNWVSEGIAEFGDILRKYSDNLEELSYAVISGLVRYLEINQGGFFMVDRDSDYGPIEMIACHAYSRRKFPDQKLDWGEGLVGAVIQEQKSYYTDKIPDGYLTITSGLGKANPRYLLLVPMVLNEEVFGVLELASFHPIESFQIQFVERVAENTAMTLNIMESNMKTARLLKETQAQAAQLAQQEEKVRQNIEELKATQAEAARQSEQFVSFTNSVNHTLIRSEYDTNGMLLYANTKFLKKLGYSGNREVEGKHISMFIHDRDIEWFNKIWSGLSKGGAHFEGYMKHITKQGQDLWTMATYTCVRRDDGSVEKILFLAIDTTEQKQESLDFEGQISAINTLSPKAEFKPDGELIYSNELFNRTLNFNAKEIENKNVFDFIHPSDQERFNEIWEQVITRNAFQGQLRMITNFEEAVWFRATFTAVDDMYGDVEKVIFIANEITKEREMEISLREQHKQLLRKEEEMRMQTLDLKRQIEDITDRHASEKAQLIKERTVFDAVIDQLPYPVVTINNQGYITKFNRSASEYWGNKPEFYEKSKAAMLFDKTRTKGILGAFADPAIPNKEVRYERVSIPLPDRQSTSEFVSVLKIEMEQEIYYSLLIHTRDQVAE